MTSSAHSARSFSWRLSLFFGAQFFLYGVHLPFFPVWLDWRGLTPAEIGIVAAAPMLLRLFVGPAAAFLADRSGDHRRAVMIASACTLTAALSLTQSYTFLAILLLTAIYLVGAQTAGPIGEAVALAGVRDHGVDYGRMRLWGSLSFIVATLVGGALLAHFGAFSVGWMIVASAGLVMLAAWLLPSASARTDVAEVRAPITLRAVRKVAGSGNFLLFIAAAGTVQASHALFYGFGVLHWQSLGISTELISVLWSISIVAEVALFAYAGWLVRLLGPLGLILVGGIAAIVRWGSMAFDPPIVALFLLQTLHALTFAATHLGSMHFIQQAVPREQAGTAQAIYAAVTGGLITAGAMLLSGAIYGPYAGLSYLAMMVIAGVGVMAGLILKRRWTV